MAEAAGTRECKHCGGSFVPGRVFGAGRKYCSSNCRHDSRRLEWEKIRLTKRIRNRLTPERKNELAWRAATIFDQLKLKYVRVMGQRDFIVQYNDELKAVRVDVGRQKSGSHLVYEFTKDGTPTFRPTCRYNCQGCPRCGIADELNGYGQDLKLEGYRRTRMAKDEYEGRREQRIRVRHQQVKLTIPAETTLQENS